MTRSLRGAERARGLLGTALPPQAEELQSCAGQPQAGPSPAKAAPHDVERLRLELAELQEAGDEQEAQDSLELHDLRLERLRLTGLLERFQEKLPTLEDVAARYGDEATELRAEVVQLKEENALAALGRGSPGARGEDCEDLEPVRSLGSSANCLLEEASFLWHREAEAAGQAARLRVQERCLEALRGETRHTMERLRQEERKLDGLRERFARAEAYQRELADRRRRLREEVEAEHAELRDLRCQVLVLKEACVSPVKLKKHCSTLLKGLDREGGPRAAQRRARGLQLCQQLYSRVAETAPALQALAGRAAVAARHEFDRYRLLEEAHNLALQRVHTAVARGLLRDGDGRSASRGP